MHGEPEGVSRCSAGLGGVLTNSEITIIRAVSRVGLAHDIRPAKPQRIRISDILRTPPQNRRRLEDFRTTVTHRRRLTTQAQR